MFNTQMMQANLAGKKTVTRRCNTTLKAGDVVYVKETYLLRNNGNSVVYKADLDSMEAAGIAGMYGGWKSPLFMPEKYSRMKLEIVSVRHEELHKIDCADCVKEGVSTILEYVDLWNEINSKKEGKLWSDNPTVYRIEYKIMG